MISLKLNVAWHVRTINDLFLSRYGPDVPALFSGPLSEVNTTSVFSSNPYSLTDSKIPNYNVDDVIDEIRNNDG